MSFLRNPDMNQLLENLEEDAGEDGLPFGRFTRRRRREPKDPNRFPKVPSDEGSRLMRTGLFGASDYDRRTRKRLARRMLERELSIGDFDQRKRNNDLLTQVRGP